MPEYRRARTPGATYFFTVVSHQRHPILCDPAVRSALRAAILTVRSRYPFTIDAWVLLPDHTHSIWTLPEYDHAYSLRWSMIKRLVTKAVGNGYGSDSCHGAHGAPYNVVRPGGRVRHAYQIQSDSSDDCGFGNKPLMSASRKWRREGAIWQRRFWEHQVRDQNDLNRCIDYLHWNPVKHGYAESVIEWPYSTFHRYVRKGVYTADWGGKGIVENGAFGE